MKTRNDPTFLAPLWSFQVAYEHNWKLIFVMLMVQKISFLASELFLLKRLRRVE